MKELFSTKNKMNKKEFLSFFGWYLATELVVMIFYAVMFLLCVAVMAYGDLSYTNTASTVIVALTAAYLVFVFIAFVIWVIQVARRLKSKKLPAVLTIFNFVGLGPIMLIVCVIGE